MLLRVRMTRVYNESILQCWERGNTFSFRSAAAQGSVSPVESHLLVPLEKAWRVKLCEVPFLQDLQDNRP